MARPKNDGRGRLGGRQKGTPNRATLPLRDALSSLWEDYITSGTLQSDMQELTPHDRMLFMEKFAAYLAPKQKSVEVDMTLQDLPETITDRLARLASDPSDD